jgi:aminomethyltransferase
MVNAQKRLQKASEKVEALEKQKQTGTAVLMMGFELTERGIPRAGYSIFSDGKEIAKVASGTFSPTLQKGIGTAFFPTAIAKPGQPIEVEINQKRVKAVVSGLTFHRKK